MVEAFRRSFARWLGAWHQPVRGFFERLGTFEADDLVAHGLDQPYEIAPCNTMLGVSFATDHIASLVGLPELTRFRELAFSDTTLTPVAAAQLATCPFLDQLEHLGLFAAGLGDAELSVLSRATAFSRLLSLDLSCAYQDQHYTVAGLQALAAAPFARTLRSLAVANLALGDDVVDALARFPALDVLDLSHTGLTDLGALRLCDFPHPLTLLTVERNDLSDDAKRALVLTFGDRVVM